MNKTSCMIIVCLVGLLFVGTRAQGNNSSSSTGGFCGPIADNATEINAQVIQGESIPVSIPGGLAQQWKIDLCISSLPDDSTSVQQFIKFNATSNRPMRYYIGIENRPDATNSLYSCNIPAGSSECQILFPLCAFRSARNIYVAGHNPLGQTALGDFTITLTAYLIVDETVNELNPAPYLAPTPRLFLPSKFNVTAAQAPVRITVTIQGLTTIPQLSDGVSLYVRKGLPSGMDAGCYNYKCDVNLAVATGITSASCSLTLSTGFYYTLLDYKLTANGPFLIRIQSVSLPNAAVSGSTPGLFVALVCALALMAARLFE